jgi:glycerol-3-phosphate O-acyltransferase/dihydroxyacetone phosphate acyltransferase
MSSGKPGLWQKKSGAAAVEAQENLLSHPMVRILGEFASRDFVSYVLQNWLDERLFGWSRSAGRGTSAWAGSLPRSRDGSRAASPDVSDDEDAGDYDNVLGILRLDDGQASPNRAGSRSQHGSYADLQKLKVVAVQGQSPTMPAQPGSPTEGGFHRRERRASLSDRVTVERISALDPREQFKDCTEDINDEIRKSKPSTSEE